MLETIGLWLYKLNLGKRPATRRLKSLGAMERDGIVRCFGRLNNSDLPPEAKSPILLPRNHAFTNLMIRACHERVLHGGTGQTLAELRKEYWVSKGTSTS